jgi:drug/metabolite transporter (DMT)-like permease
MKKALFQLHIAVLLAGFTAILGKLIDLNEGMLVIYRMLLTALFLGITLQSSGKLSWPGWAEGKKILGVGAVIAFHWVSFYGSVKYGNISIAVICISGAGFFSAIFEPILLRQRFYPIEIFLGLLSIAGILIIFDFHPQYKIGIIFGIFSAIGSALFPIFNKQLLQRHQPDAITFYEMIGGTVFLLAVLPFYNQLSTAAYWWPTPTDWLYLLILSLVCTVLCFNLQLNALKKISPFTVNLSYNLEPVYGILLAFFFFNENKHLNGYFYLGVLLILLSVALQMFRVWHKNRFQPTILS